MDEKKNYAQDEVEAREERIQSLRNLLEASQFDRMKALLAEMEAEDIAEILGEFSEEEKIKIVESLSTDEAATVLDDTDPQSRLQILQTFKPEQLAEIIGEMPPDEAADIVEEVSEEEREDLLDLMEKEDAEEVEEILGYPEDSAGRVMNPEFIAVKEGDDVEDAVGHIRSLEIEEEVFNVYVVDGEERLKGIVPVKKLLIARRGTLIKDILEDHVHSVLADTDQEQAALIMKKYDLLALPVVDAGGKLVGRITVDDIIDVIDEEVAEDISKMTGTIEEEWGNETTIKATQNRLPWLVTCMLGSIVTGLVIQMFEVTLAETIALVSFIPVITATGGNSGVQAATVVVRGIALGHMDFTKLGEEVLRQFKIAISLGLVCGIVLTVLADIWKKSSVVGMIVGLSIFLVVVWSNFVGVFAPMILRKMRIDPAIASGPFITTLNDIVGVFIYLSVAAFLL